MSDIKASGAEPLDLEAVADKWLRTCGPCDAGLPMACTHPNEDYRNILGDALREIGELRDRLGRVGDGTP